MTSFKKPLIAIASAVVLATTTFIALPANAAVTTTLTIATTAATGGTTEATAIALPVPADNSVDAADALDFALAGITAGETVTVVATDATLIKAGTTGTVTATTGESALSIPTGTGNTAAFKVYTKTTKTGKVVVTVGTAIPVTYYVKGTAGALNTITVSAPTAALGTTAKVTVSGADVFGNVVNAAAIALQVISSKATTPYTLTTGVTGTATQDIASLSVDTYDLVATATVATAVTGLTTPVGFVKGQFKVVDLAALVTTKDAELAVANAKVSVAEAKYAALVKRFNALAKQYNKKVSKKSQVKLVN